MRTVSGLALGLLLLVGGSAMGCSGCNEKALATGDGGAGIPSSLTPEQAARVLAKVGAHTITLGDFVAALEHMDQFSRIRYQAPEARRELLNEMINVTLLAEEAREKGYDKDPLAQQEARAILRDALLAKARQGLQEPGAIPEAEVRAYYDTHKAEVRDPERRRVSVIVLPDQVAAREVLESLGASRGPPSASKWASLVRARSLDAPKADSKLPDELAGDLGVVAAPGERELNTKVPVEVRAAVFMLKDNGEVLDRPVQAGQKVYVVRLTQRFEAHERSFAEAERTLRVKMAQDKMKAKEDELMKELRTQFPVKIDEEGLAKVRIDIGSPSPVPFEPQADAGHD